MINGLRVIALIPARQGSKGLPNKNTLDFLGKPLFTWSIEAAKGSKYIDKILLSTDSDLIAEIGLRFGAAVPFIRPKNLSGDYSASIDVIDHAINFLELNLNEIFQLIVLLEPTSPLRTSEDIDDSLEKLVSTPNATSLVSIGKAEAQDLTLQFKLLSDDFLQLPKEKKAFIHHRRQDIKAHYFLDGSIYISNIKMLLAKKTFVHDQTIANLLPKWKTIEIDDEYDYHMALALARIYL